MARILVIDDDEAIRFLLEAALKQEGHVVCLASDGQEATRSYQTAAPDLVITDMLMPQMEGFEVIHFLRQQCPSLKIIGISGGGELAPQHYLEVARKLGADRVLRKPLHLPDLLATVGELLAPMGPAQQPLSQ